MRDALSATLVKPRFLLILMAVFAIAALSLAVVGVYAVLAHTVSQRGREIGIRIALGARLVDIGRIVLGPAVALTVTGAFIGIGGALGLRQVIASVLYGFSPTDPLTIASVAALLIATAVVGMILPARRAALPPR